MYHELGANFSNITRDNFDLVTRIFMGILYDSLKKYSASKTNQLISTQTNQIYHTTRPTQFIVINFLIQIRITKN